MDIKINVKFHFDRVAGNVFAVFRSKQRNMKTIPVALISLVLFGGAVHAQRTSVIRDTTVTQVSRDSAMTKDTAVNFPTMIPINQMEQTKNYHWDNGQTATPTGRQAGDPSVLYARVIGDSAIVIYDWREKLKSLKRSSAKN